MASKTLALIFMTSGGKKATLTVRNIRDNITANEIKAVMDLIIEKDLFFSSTGALISKDSAQIIDKSVVEFDLKS